MRAHSLTHLHVYHVIQLYLVYRYLLGIGLGGAGTRIVTLDWRPDDGAACTLALVASRRFFSLEPLRGVDEEGSFGAKGC